MTVEASVIVPLMIMSYVLFMYMIVHEYDRILICQDTYMMTVYACRDYMDDKKTCTQKADRRFDEIRRERAYLSLSELAMSLTKNKEHIRIEATGNFVTPFGEGGLGLFPSKDGTIEDGYEKSLWDPVSIMLTTKDLKGEK